MSKFQFIDKVVFVLDAIPYVLRSPQKMKSCACVLANIAMSGDWVRLKYAIKSANTKSKAYKQTEVREPYKCSEVYALEKNTIDAMGVSGISVLRYCPLYRCGECTGYNRESGKCLLDNKGNFIAKQKQTAKKLYGLLQRKQRFIAKVFKGVRDKEK